MTVGGCATFILTLGEVLTLWLLAVSLGISLIVSTCPDVFRECFVLVWGGGMGENRLGKFRTNQNLHARDMPPL